MCEIKFPNTTLEIANVQLKKTENAFIADAKDAWEQIVNVFKKNVKYADGTNISFVALLFALMFSCPLLIFDRLLLFIIINAIFAIIHIVYGILKIKSNIDVNRVCKGDPSEIIADTIEKYRYQCPKEKTTSYINGLREHCRLLLVERKSIDNFDSKYLTFGPMYTDFLEELSIIDSLQNVDTTNLKVTRFYIENYSIPKNYNIPCVKIEENIKNKFSKTYNLKLTLEPSSETDAENIIRNTINNDNIIIDLSYIDKMFANVKL